MTDNERRFSFRKSLLFLVLCTVTFILFYQYRVAVTLSPENILDFRSFTGLHKLLRQAPLLEPPPKEIQPIPNITAVTKNIAVVDGKPIMAVPPPSKLLKTPQDGVKSTVSKPADKLTTAKPNVQSGKPTEKSKDTKPAETKPTEKLKDTKSAETKPTEAKPNEVKSPTTVAPKPLTTSPKPPKCKNAFRQEFVQKKSFICCHPIGGLGNRLFIYAAAYGIAAKLNRTLVLDKGQPFVKFFSLSAKIVDDYKCVTSGSKGKGSNIDCAFDKSMFNIPKGDNYCVGSYLQSYMYFDHVKEDIKKQFTFKQNYTVKAKGVINGALEKYKTQTKRTEKPVIVGVHIRRGDFVNHGYGYDVATPKYMANATGYYRRKYDRVVFLVCSNGMDWAKKNIQGDDVVYLEGNDYITDMAVLVSCDHIISSVGSFSWWAGYLAGGEVVYYQWPAREKTRLRKQFRYEEYFPKNWIGMS